MRKQKENRKSGGLESFSKLVSPLAKNILGKKGFVGTDILFHWEEIVGQGIAKFCFPDKIDFKKDQRDNGTLHVITTNGAFATEIKHKENLILEKINTYFGYRAVSGLKIIQSQNIPQNTPGQIAAVKMDKTLVSPDEENYIMDLVDGLEDNSLKDVMIRLGKNIFGNKRKSE